MLIAKCAVYCGIR